MAKQKELEKYMNQFTLPVYGEIPDVGLYLEQVAKYINTYLVDFPDMMITTSMISNYAKQKLIDRVNKKTYSRDQIAVLLFIIMTKTVLSIDNIRTLLAMKIQDKNQIETFYNDFRSRLLHILGSFNSSRSVSSAPDTDQIMSNIATAIAHKMYLESYFNNQKDA